MEKNINAIRNIIIYIFFPWYGAISIIATWTSFQYPYPIVISCFRFTEVILVPILILNYILSKPTYKAFSIYLLILLLGIYSSVKVGDHRFLFFILFLYGAINTNYKKTLTIDLISKILIFAVTLFSYGAGFITDVQYQRVGAASIRHGLGFAHPNFLGMIVMLICLEYILLRNSNLTFIEVVIWIGIIVCIDVYSDTRSTEAVSIITLLIAFFFKSLLNKKNVFNKNKKFFEILPTILTICSYLLVNNVKPGSALYNFIIQYDSSRLNIFQFYYNIAGLHLFPEKINTFFMDSTFVGMDNAYILLLVSFGIISLVVYVIVLTYLIWIMINKNETYLLLITIMLLIFGLVESTVIYPFVGFYIVTLQRNYKQSNV